MLLHDFIIVVVIVGAYVYKPNEWPAIVVNEVVWPPFKNHM